MVHGGVLTSDALLAGRGSEHSEWHKRRMNIGFIYGPSYPPTSGGTIHGYQLVSQLHALGHTVSNWYFDHGGNPLIRHWQGRQLAGFLASIDVLYLRIEWRLSPAICTLFGNVPGRRVPVVWELNGTPYETLYNQRRGNPAAIIRQLRLLARGCATAIAVLLEIDEFGARVICFRRTHSFPNGSDEKMFRPAVRVVDSTKPLSVVWIGTSAAGWHDLDTLIATARESERRGLNIEFVIFGDPQHLPSPLPGNVVAAGIVPYTKLGEAIAGGDVGVHLFKRDPGYPPVVGSPLKVFDYMACGLAVVTNAAGQQSRLIRQWDAGTQTTGTVDDLLDALDRLERDRSDCARLGSNGRRAVETYFNWRRVAKETIEVLDGLVQDARR
jgi:glycosyltransferase involved in cell wall biosynthesis